MKKGFDKIAGFLKEEKLRKDKRVVVYLVCVLIATALWFLNALSKDYITTISYPVKYINAPKNQFLANQPPAKLDLKVEAHGFTLLRHKLSLSFSPVVLNLSTIIANLEPNSQGYSIQTNNLLRKVSEQISNEIKINEIQPGIIIIRLDSLKSKMVPVKINVDLKFKTQFDLKEPYSTVPGKIEITGPAAVLDTILFLETERKTFDKLDAGIEKYIDIVYPKNISILPKKVLLKIQVEKFTEKELKVPIRVKNKPENLDIKLFPSHMKLTILVGLSEFGDIEADDFSVTVDFEKIQNNVDFLDLSIDSKPTTVKIIRYSPEIVEYLMETN